MTTTFLISLGSILVAFSLVWVLSLARKDASVIDPFWGLGFILVAALAAQINRPTPDRVILLQSLTAIWGIRLAVYLFSRNRGHPEDRRYAAMRESRGKDFWWFSWFSVFALQAIILWFVSLPLQFAAVERSANGWGWLDALGIALWGAGFAFESIGDWQLARFKAEPRNVGKILDTGLWRYTRHPNYFGDFLVWWGLYLIAAAGGAWPTFLSPLSMSFLLLRFSGVPLLEKTIGDRRPDYAAYRARTSAFFPWPPRANP